MVITKDSESFDPGSSPGRTSRFRFFFFFFILASRRIPERTGWPCPGVGLRVHSSAVERRIADPEVAGSIPVAPLNLFIFFTEAEENFCVVCQVRNIIARGIGLVV